MTKWLKTTAKQFESYKKFSGEWQKRLGLTNWAIYYKHRVNREEYGGCSWNVEGATATVFLSKEWDDFRELNDYELNRLALHEMLHILLISLVHIGESRYATASELEFAEHSIIRQLETVLLEERNA